LNQSSLDNIDEFADLNKLCLLDSETSIDVSRNFVARLYDEKGKMKSAHDNLKAITCIQEDSGYGKYHGLEDSDDHPLFL
jgi:hypothetical protein